MLIENRLKVSVWVGAMLEEAVYCEYAVEEDWDADGPKNQLSADAGVFSIGGDFLGGNFVAGRGVPLSSLMKPLAYSESYADAVVQAAQTNGLPSPT